MKTSYYLFLGLFLLLTAAACEDDDNMALDLDVPETYVFTRDGASTVSFSGQSERIAMAEELTAAMLDFDNTATDLNNMFTNAEGTNPFSDPDLNASTKSIRSKVAASQDLFSDNTVEAAEIKSDFDRYIFNQANEVFPNRDQMASNGQAGQLADGNTVRYFGSWGLENDQAFAKSLVGALMYDQAANHYLSPDVLLTTTNQADNDAMLTVDGESYTTMEHFWDEAFGYVFGASANPATPLMDLGTADNFLNDYLGEVADQGSFTAISVITERSFRTGRAAVLAGRYEDLIPQQAIMVRAELNKVLAARASMFLCEAIAELEATPINQGGALNALSKAYGSVYALRFISNDSGNFVFGDFNAVSDLLIELLRNEDNFGFWGLTANELRVINTELQDFAVAAGVYPDGAFFCN